MEIRAFRERLGFKTQTSLAENLGIKAANVSEWEKGSGYPSYTVLKKMLELGATVEELFGIEYEKIHNYEKKEEISSSKRLHDIEKRLLALEGREMLRQQRVNEQIQGFRQK